MKSLIAKSVRHGLLGLLMVQIVLLTGCTSALWDENTFADRYRPSNPTNLQLFYSHKRQDILVTYRELREKSDTTRSRCYWLKTNTQRVNRERKPHFVAARPKEDLIPIAVSEMPPGPSSPGHTELQAVVREYDGVFTLYLGPERLDPCKLPTYMGASQRVKQVALTPFTLGVDATILGAVIGYYSAPGFFAGLSR